MTLRVQLMIILIINESVGIFKVGQPTAQMTKTFNFNNSLS